MKITSTDLALHADHTALARREAQQQLRAWRGAQPDNALSSVITAISTAARDALAQIPVSIDSSAAQAIEAAEDAVANDPILSLIKQMIEHFTGQEVRIFDMQSFSAELEHTEVRTQQTQAALTSDRTGWGLEYDYRAVAEEFESTRFSAEGVIRTADGQEIRFDLDLEMTRSYREETAVSVRAGDAVQRKDPLVVNFGGSAAQLAALPDQRFRFDLDSDGQSELLPTFASGSGYLALDKNGNGRIDNGRELFGPRRDDGFAELAELDDDGNGWIDEGDAAFDKLLVWTPSAAGDGSLRSLADLGIGALGLAHLATPFALRGQDNADLGQTRASGLYLAEDGRSGTVQEIDLTV